MVFPVGKEFRIGVQKSSKIIKKKNVPSWTKAKKTWYTGPELISQCECTQSKQDLREYLLTSTLHGLKYIGEGRLTWFERFFWLISFIFSVIGAAFFILNVYQKWSDSPMIISVSPEPKTLKSIPFPAITICNVNQAKKSVATRIYFNGTRLDRKLLQGTCSSHNETALADLDATISADWEYFKNYLISITQPCSEMLALCMWKGEIRNCDNLFNTQLTDEGLCCTFNAVHKDMMFWHPKEVSDLNITFPFPAVDWTPENGYPDDAPADGFPWRPIGTGVNLGLSLVLDVALMEYFCSSINGAGFKMLLHNPTETPKIAEYGILLPPGKEVRVVVDPRIDDALPQLISIPLAKRKCLFAKERTLHYFRTYSQKNCVMECEARLQIERCNCTQYFMPKNFGTTVCSKSDTKCYLEVKALIQDKFSLNRTTEEECDECLPACSELSYMRDVSFASFDEVVPVHPDILAGRSVDYFIENMLILHVYFEESSFNRFTKGEIFGLTEFLSNTGGLLGLCMGFSVMSLVELIYFISLRTIFKRRKIIVPKYPFIQ